MQVIETPSQLLDAIGKKRVQDALNVGRSAIYNALKAGKLPPSWFDVIDTFARSEGVDCPRRFFAFVVPPSTNGDSQAHIQGVENINITGDMRAS